MPCRSPFSYLEGNLVFSLGCSGQYDCFLTTAPIEERKKFWQKPNWRKEGRKKETKKEREEEGISHTRPEAHLPSLPLLLPSFLPSTKRRRRNVQIFISVRHDRSRGRRPNCFLGLSLNDRTVLFLVILLDKTVSVG